MGMGVARTAFDKFSRLDLELFLGLAGFITNLLQVRNLLNSIVQIYPHIKLD